ncbi:Transcriptional regulator, TetR family [Croceitalea dokdonensis DOKDO 023]|uniref:Transcriptional regulator, TetR family n=1 Tax=Croceitalea dokdonensis DOKDO 023 TaxID=1300341 RepID=A0A0P7AQD6_9FLAO|nr:TetR family transcriptional regulator [Croceitalea dokdonensis]KPM30966.1 Transcriptional regulator, TetR family [Croceitalea dokdonensis DOKDO 023]
MSNSIANSSKLHQLRARGLSFFYQNGYYSTTTEELLAHLSITKEAFEATFSSKKQFFIGIAQNLLLQRTLNLLIEPNSYKQNPFPSILQMLENELENSADSPVDGGFMLNTFLTEFHGKDKEVSKVLVQILRIWEINLLSLLKKGQLDGYVDQHVDAESAAKYIVSSFIGIRTLMGNEDPRRLKRQYLQQLRYYFNSIAKQRAA